MKVQTISDDIKLMKECAVALKGCRFLQGETLGILIDATPSPS